MTKVERSVAERDVRGWLDFKNISDRKRTDNNDQIEALIEAVQDGAISIDEQSKEIIQKLRIPIKNDEGETTVESLTYVPRVKVYELHDKLEGVKGSDVHGMVLAYASALTKQKKVVLKHMDSGDYSIAQTISIFFM